METVRMTRSTGLLLALIWLTALFFSTSATDASGKIGEIEDPRKKKDNSVQEVKYAESHLTGSARMIKLDCEYSTEWIEKLQKWNKKKNKIAKKTECYYNPDPHDQKNHSGSGDNQCLGYNKNAGRIYENLARTYRDGNCVADKLETNECTWNK